MKQYSFRMNLGYKPLDGTNITVKAESESAARKEVLRIIKTATRDLKPESLEFLGTGPMTPSRVARLDAQRLGSLGGKKSRRTISPEDQRKMQEARKRNSSQNVKAHTSLTEGELRSEQDSAPTQPPETTVGQGLCDATCSASSFCESNDVPKINANPVANRVGSLAPLIAFILCFSCTRSWANVFTAVSFEDFQGSEKLFSFPKSDVFLSDDNRSAMNFGNGCFVVSVAKSSGLCLHPVEEHQDKLAIGSAAASRIAAKSESVSICSSEVSCNHCNDPCCDSPWRLFGPVHIVFMGIAYMLGWYVDYLRSKSSYVILPNKQL